MFKQIQKCRICGNTDLIPILDLGIQTLTGVFPKTKDQFVSSGPLELVKCSEYESGESCGLVQLRHSYNISEMYGENYGYRSGLNQSMVNHLNCKVNKILKWINPQPGDLVIDIGSNDGTLLKAYSRDDLNLVGIDPTGLKFKDCYPDHIKLIPEFFSAEALIDHFGKQKAKIVTSIAMFYDLEDPLDFMKQIYEILLDDGIWVFEQSYMPNMMEMNAYDTICHEHLEFYRLAQIKWLTDKAGFKIIDIEFNLVNGGSFAVIVAKANSKYSEDKTGISNTLNKETENRLDKIYPYIDFRDRILRHREELCGFIHKEINRGKTIYGYGASTKGNVVFQFCGFTYKDIPFIAEINEDKFGCYTPGTHIPIVPEQQVRDSRPDYLLILPWHFRENIINREKQFLSADTKLLFPLPAIDVVSL